MTPAESDRRAAVAGAGAGLAIAVGAAGLRVLRNGARDLASCDGLVFRLAGAPPTAGTDRLGGCCYF